MAYNDKLTSTEINSRILVDQDNKLDFLLKLYFENDGTHRIANGIQENIDAAAHLDSMIYAEAARSNLVHPHELPALRTMLIDRDGHLKRTANGFALTENGNAFWKAGKGGYVKQSKINGKLKIVEFVKTWLPVTLSACALALSIYLAYTNKAILERLDSLEKRLEQVEKKS